MMDVRITLETLYDILRNEKKKAELQKLSETFFSDVVTYLRQKQVLLESLKQSEDLFIGGEREKLEYELRSILRIIKEIYEKREKKIIDIALNKSRTQSDVIDTRSFLAEEREMYRSLVESFDFYRKGVLINLLRGSLPSLSILDQAMRSGAESSPPASAIAESSSSVILEESSEVPPATGPLEAKLALKKIKFIKPVPDFVWTDLKEYGPFKVDDQTEIFPEVADLLIRKGHAVEMME